MRGVHFKAFLPQSFLYENLFHMRIKDEISAEKQNEQNHRGILWKAGGYLAYGGKAIRLWRNFHEACSSEILYIKKKMSEISEK